MIRRTLTLALLLAAVGCRQPTSPVVVLDAQTLPLQLAVDVHPLNEPVDFYKLLLDGVQVGSDTPCPGPAICTVTFAMGATGDHQLTVVASRQVLSTDPSVLVDSPPSPPLPFRINGPAPAPAVPTNLRKGA